MSQMKKMLDEMLYEEFIQNMIFGFADRWEEEVLMQEAQKEEKDESVVLRDIEEYESLPF